MGTRLKITVALAILIISVAALLVALWASNISPVGYIPPLDISPVNPQYLKNSYGHNDTRIFLVSAIPSYGGYPFQDVSGYYNIPAIHKGDLCFIINVTVRNDYSPLNPLPSSGMLGWNSSTAVMALTAELYDRNNGTIQSTNVTPQYPTTLGGILSAPYLYLERGETYSFNMYLSVANQNVDAFSIVALYVGSMRPP